MKEFSRAAIVFVDLNPVEGNEQGSKRPCVIVSDLKQVQACYPYPIYTIIPFTTTSYSKSGSVLAPIIEARSGALSQRSTALIMQIRAIAPTRIIKELGKMNESEMNIILKALLFHVGLSTF